MMEKKNNDKGELIDRTVWFTRLEGNWHTEKSGGKMNLHVFEERSGGFSLNYWSSNKTLLLHGNSGQATLIENKIDNIEKLSTKPAQTEKLMEVINPESKMKGGNKILSLQVEVR